MLAPSVTCDVISFCVTRECVEIQKSDGNS